MAQSKTYHHGNLRRSLVSTATSILEKRGRSALTLRECARLVNVSHNAPNYHFADLRGLLTAVAAAGYRDLSRRQNRAIQRLTNPGDQLLALAREYMSFARASPARFRLMFSDEGVDSQNTEYQQVVTESWSLLAGVMADFLGEPTSADYDAFVRSPRDMLMWSSVHGLASLMIDGKLRSRRFKNKAAVDDYVDSCLKPVIVGLKRLHDQR